MKKSLIVGLLTCVMLLSFAGLVFAEEDIFKLQELPTTVTDQTTFFKVLKNAGNIIFTALIILAVVFFLLAAFQFITGGGDAEQISSARNKLIWAVVGIGVAFVAKGLPNLVQTILKQ